MKNWAKLENWVKLENPYGPRVVRINMHGQYKARVILTDGKEKLYIMLSLDVNNWETLIKRGFDPEDQSKKLFGAQAKDHSPLWVTQDGDLVLDSTRTYGSTTESDLYIVLTGCKRNVQTGQSGQAIVKSSGSFPYSSNLSWICDEGVTAVHPDFPVP